MIATRLSYEIDVPSTGQPLPRLWQQRSQLIGTPTVDPVFARRGLRTVERGPLAVFSVTSLSPALQVVCVGPQQVWALPTKIRHAAFRLMPWSPRSSGWVWRKPLQKGHHSEGALIDPGLILSRTQLASSNSCSTAVRDRAACL